MNLSNEFTTAFKFTAKWEGGWSDDKADPGGKTFYGISDGGDGTIDGLVDLDRDGDGDKRVEDLTREEALDIYYKFYWLASGCDKLELASAVAVFDTAVNCGVGRAKRWLKASKTVKEFLDLRRQHYYTIIDNNPSLGKFKKGWLNRMNDLIKYVEVLES